MSLKALRLIDTYPDKAQATTAMLFYAAELFDRGDTERFGVFIEPITVPRSPRVWGVYLIDRQYAPTREAARARAKTGRVNDE